MKKKERLRRRRQFQVPPQPPVATEVLLPPIAPEDHKQLVEAIRIDRPALEARIRVSITRCRDIFQRYDPAVLLTALADTWAFGAFDPLQNQTEGGGDAFLEYAISLAGTVPPPIPSDPPPPEILAELEELIQAIHHGASQFHGFQHLGEDGADAKDSVRAHQMISAIYQRGNSMEPHQIDLVRSLFSEHSPFFQDRLGLRLEDILAATRSLYLQPLDKANGRLATWRLLREVVDGLGRPELLARLAESRSQAEMITILRAIPEIQRAIPDFEQCMEALTHNPYELEITSTAQRKLLRLVSMALGANQSFLEPHDWACWPLTQTDVILRPVLGFDGHYFAFLPQMIWRNLEKILSAYIESTDPTYFETFLKQRGKWLERESVRLLAQRLPGATVHSPLYYNVVEGGIQKRMEIDGLLTYDGHVILLSAKSGQVTAPARRGALPSLRKAFTDLVKAGFDQIIKARKYILDNPNGALFETASGAEVVIAPPARGRFFFPINVTLEDMGSISMQFEDLRAAGILRADEFFWSVQFNDLRVITEIIESPISFLLYWNRRIAAYSVAQFAPCEELDCFMYFLEYGLYFQDDDADKNERMYVNLTHDLDSYYGALELGLPATKPQHALHEGTWEIIRGLEQTRDDGFTVVGMIVCGTSGSMQKFAANLVERLKAMNRADGKPHQLSEFFSDFDMGINIGCVTVGDQKAMDRMTTFSFLKKYESKFTHWHTILLEMLDGVVVGIRCRTTSFPWKHDPEMDRPMQLLRQNRDNRMGVQGRNDRCRCGSGEKYKKCCGAI